MATAVGAAAVADFAAGGVVVVVAVVIGFAVRWTFFFFSSICIEKGGSQKSAQSCYPPIWQSIATGG